VSGNASADGGASDAALVARALNNDDAAFAALMGRHKHWAQRFIRRYVGAGNDEAYDLLQETFFAAWLALSRYNAELSFATWLRQIALNKCRDRSRRNKVRRFLLGQATDDAELPEPIDPAPGPEVAVGDAAEFARLERHVNELPRSLKEPLLLTALEGLSQQEAGAVLGISAKAVEMRVYRAREKLTQLR
jgi:RNA polymerase sigma-70 factor (ECF subfamily)